MTGCCSSSVEWSKQNLADSVQEAHNLRLRDVNEGRDYPAPVGTVERSARWFGAGFPDYPWMFATDGEYTAFAAVAAGQFDTAKAAPAGAARHQRARQRRAAARSCTR